MTPRELKIEAKRLKIRINKVCAIAGISHGTFCRWVAESHSPLKKTWDNFIDVYNKVKNEKTPL